MPPSRRLSLLPAALAQLPDAPRLYLRLEVFVKQELVPASKPDASLASHIFNKIESIRTAVTQAQIARQNAQSNTILPSDPGSQPSLSYDILDARYDSLKYERQYLSIVYYQIARLGYFSPNEVQKSINWLAANPNDATTSYILAATLAAFNSAEPHSFPGKGTIAYMKQQLAPNTYWKEPGLKATILLKWTLFMAETQYCDPTLENQQGFKTEELESQIWDAVQADAFTYLAAALIQFHKRTHTSPISSFAQFVQFLPVLNMCDVLVSSELRKIKQRQEDLLVSQPALQNDIPMLYSLIGVLYVLLPPERALQFWGATPTGETRGLSYMELTETSAGKLPSFLQWAVWSTQVRDVDMTMALYDMLSGLAKGQKCSELAYNFLTRGGGEVIPGSSLPSSTGSYNAGPSISWSTIFALLESWTSPAPSPCTNQPPSLATSFGGFSSLAISQPHPPTQQPPQHIPIGPKDVLLAQSFLRLLSTVAMSSVAVRLAISSNTQFRAIPTLVSLVPLGIPLELKGAIFDVLAAFCEPGAGVAGVDICKSVWTLMERVKVINVRAPVSGRAVGAGAVLPPVKGVEVELDEVEAVYKLYPATIPFLNLLATLLHMPKRLSPRSLLADAEPLNTIPESLGQPYRLPGIGPYVSFMVDNRWQMNDLCLKFVERALAGWEIENLVRAKTVILLLIHPGFEVLARLLTNFPLQSTILSYIVNGIEGFEHELPSEEPYFLLTIIRVLCIIHRVLEIHDLFLDVLVPILSEFDSMPFVGTVHSMSFYTRFDQALTYGTKYIPAIATYVIYPAYPELVLAVRIISQLSCSTSVMSLLILIERSPDSERILSSFRQLLDIDSLDDVDMAETTQSIVPVLVLQTEKPKSHWIKLSGSQSSTSSSVTWNVKQRTPISAISSCSAVQCRHTNDSARRRCMQNHFSMSSQR
ncbi:nucleoporin Nup186/Nup192/Nup205 [Boletus edulis]|nr:nucleoporin Nup186/Nup192/Nup205 [Boletus edulis]